MCSGAIISSRTAADASDRASAIQLQSTQMGIAEQRRQYDQTRADQMPWMEAGKNALTELVAKVKAGPGDFTKGPGYDFRLKEGAKALDRGASASGSVLSGRAAKGMNRYAQDYASNEYNNFIQGYYQSLTPLQSLSGTGQTTAANLGTQGTSTANNISSLLVNQGNNQSNNIIALANQQGKAYNTGTQNLANLGQYIQWQNSKGGNTYTPKSEVGTMTREQSGYAG